MDYKQRNNIEMNQSLSAFALSLFAFCGRVMTQHHRYALRLDTLRAFALSLFVFCGRVMTQHHPYALRLCVRVLN